ncbi:F-box domain containing protein [Tanacetum coccineum]
MMKRTLPQQLTLYLNEHGVLQSKGIAVETYEIKYMFPKVVRQAEDYRDCGVWVCIFLYRLSCNLPLTVDDPLQTALAYRKWMLQYFWSHKIQTEKTVVLDEDDNLIHTPALTNLHIVNLKPIGTSHGVWCFSYGNNMMVSIANLSIKKEVGVFVPNSQPDNCKILLGFGVRPDNLDPTIVRISYPSFVEGNWSVYVFTLSSLRWEQLDINRLPRESIRFKRSTQAVVGQFIYWVGHERILADSGDSYKHYLLVSFDMINHCFQVIDIPDVVMRGLSVPLYVSNIRNSLVLSGNIPIPEYYVFVCCQLSIDGGFITSAPAIMTMPSNHFLKLLGFNNHDLPIVEAATGHIMGHTVQVYMGNSQSFENVAIQGNAGSFFVGPNKESLILAAHPDHSLYCAGYLYAGFWSGGLMSYVDLVKVFRHGL